MTIIKGCRVYHIAFGQGIVTEKNDKIIKVRYSKYKLEREYPIKANNKIIFLDEGEFVRFYREISSEIDPLYLISRKYENIRETNIYFNLVDILISKKNSIANLIVRDILYFLSRNDQSYSRICEKTLKIANVGDHATAINIAIELELEDCFETVLYKYFSSIDDIKTAYLKIERNLKSNHEELLPQFYYFIDSLDGNNTKQKSFLQYRKEELQKEKEYRRQCLVLERLKKSYSPQIENNIETLSKRKINYLVHFTDVRSLPSILKYGLVPPVQHAFLGINTFRTDSNNRARTSLSIEFPNYLMLNSKKSTNREWVLILIDAKVLTDMDVYLSKSYPFENNSPFLYYSSNSASCCGFYKVDSLEEMFPNEALSYKNRAKIYRNELDIDDCYPTDPQAEICAAVTIPPTYIRKIIFQSDRSRQCYREKFGIPLGIYTDYQMHGNGLMGRRNDYMIWKEKGGYNYGF